MAVGADRSSRLKAGLSIPVAGQNTVRGVSLLRHRFASSFFSSDGNDAVVDMYLHVLIVDNPPHWLRVRAMMRARVPGKPQLFKIFVLCLWLELWLYIGVGMLNSRTTFLLQPESFVTVFKLLFLQGEFQILSFKSVWDFEYFLDFSTQSNECFKNLSKEESSGEWRRYQDEGNFTPLL